MSSRLLPLWPAPDSYPCILLSPQGEKKGPYKYKKMRNWLDKEQMPGSFAVQHSRTGMWVPLWYLGVASGQAGEACMGRR